jgi:predicted MFS family arabinose efflux permease
MAREETVSAPFSATDRGLWRASLAGMSAVLVGIGLARFAYTPLIPALIAAHWFSPSDAVYLGAANLGGYFLGAVLGRPLARAPRRPILRAMMLAASASFFAGAWPQSFLWYFIWRLVAGVSGGALMVLAAPSVLPTVPPARRGLAGGVIFTPGDAFGQGLAWSATTTAFAMGQAVAAYGFSFLFAAGSGYRLLFAIGAAALATALLIDLAAARARPRQARA